MKAQNILQTIGNTPHVRINRLYGKDHEVYVKLERANPGASIKDRIALAMIEDVLIRQRPGTAKGVVFVTLEDETGSANAVVWKDVFTANRRAVMGSRFLVVHGRLQRAGEVIHVVAERFTDLTGRLGEMRAEGEAAALEAGAAAAPPAPATRLGRSRDFH